MMAHRSDREPGHPADCPRHHSLQSRVGTWLADTIRASGHVPDRTNRPDRRLLPTKTPKPQISPCNAGAIHRRQSANDPLRTLRLRAVNG